MDQTISSRGFVVVFREPKWVLVEVNVTKTINRILVIKLSNFKSSLFGRINRNFLEKLRKFGTPKKKRQDKKRKEKKRKDNLS